MIGQAIAVSCCCASEELKAQRRVNKDIERELRRHDRHMLRELKVLLLGTGESGKSTLLKQMRIIQGTGYSHNERKAFVGHIHNNVVSSMYTLIEAMRTLEVDFERAESEQHAQLVSSAHAQGVTRLERSHVQALTSLWSDQGVQHVYARRREFELPDSARYYLDDVARLAVDDYQPSDQDILRVRIPTTGIVEYPFEMDPASGCIMRLVDLGGQRSERRKWIHCFEQITSIIFIVALSEYDQVLFEHRQVNRMEESLALFQTILTNPVLAKPSIILFLNKRDIFDEKILTSHLADYFPAYTGPKGEAESARRFIMDMFLACSSSGSSSIVDDQDQPRAIYTQYTTATDTANIRFVWKAVKDAVFRATLKDHLLM